MLLPPLTPSPCNGKSYQALFDALLSSAEPLPPQKCQERQPLQDMISNLAPDSLCSPQTLSTGTGSITAICCSTRLTTLMRKIQLRSLLMISNYSLDILYFTYKIKTSLPPTMNWSLQHAKSKENSRDPVWWKPIHLYDRPKIEPWWTISTCDTGHARLL